jgi:hypothetical protein
MGVIDIPLAKIKELPVILGEPDVLKIIQLLPECNREMRGPQAIL